MSATTAREVPSSRCALVDVTPAFAAFGTPFSGEATLRCLFITLNISPCSLIGNNELDLKTVQEALNSPDLHGQYETKVEIKRAEAA